MFTLELEEWELWQAADQILVGGPVPELQKSILVLLQIPDWTNWLVHLENCLESENEGGEWDWFLSEEHSEE